MHSLAENIIDLVLCAPQVKVDGAIVSSVFDFKSHYFTSSGVLFIMICRSSLASTRGLCKWSQKVSAYRVLLFLLLGEGGKSHHSV